MVSIQSLTSAKSRPSRELEAAKQITFEWLPLGHYFESYQQKWSIKHREAFIGTLKQYVFPLIGSLPVAAIDTGLGALGARTNLG